MIRRFFCQGTKSFFRLDDLYLSLLYQGTHYVENCKALKMLTTEGKILGVETTLGTIQCDYVVNSTGMVRCLVRNLVSDSKMI